MMMVKMLLVAEIDIPTALEAGYTDVHKYSPEAAAQAKLDAFREFADPRDHDMFLYRAPQTINREDYL